MVCGDRESGKAAAPVARLLAEPRQERGAVYTGQGEVGDDQVELHGADVLLRGADVFGAEDGRAAGPQHLSYEVATVGVLLTPSRLLVTV